MIDLDILKAFNLKGTPTLLKGGQNTSVKIGNYVLKPTYDNSHTEFIGEVLNTINPINYRISKPIKSINGKYTYKNYMATTYEEGFHKTNYQKTYETALLFHNDLNNINLNLPIGNDPWSKAHRLLFNKEGINELDIIYQDEISKLIKNLPILSDKFQIIHSDIGGNILFHNTLKPLIIDFSPAYAPVKYAIAIMIMDALVWDKLSINDFKFIEDIALYKPYLAFATYFRIITMAFNKERSYTEYKEEYNNYMDAFNKIEL